VEVAEGRQQPVAGLPGQALIGQAVEGVHGVADLVEVAGAAVALGQVLDEPAFGGVVEIGVNETEGGFMLHLAWSLSQDHAVERVNSLLTFAAR